MSQIDAQANNIVSFTVSEAQSPGGCMNTDPESPLCVRLTLTGQLVEVTDEDERDFAIKALFQRHPAMKGWPDDHVSLNVCVIPLLLLLLLTLMHCI